MTAWSNIAKNASAWIFNKLRVNVGTKLNSTTITLSDATITVGDFKINTNLYPSQTSWNDV